MWLIDQDKMRHAVFLFSHLAILKFGYGYDHEFVHTVTYFQHCKGCITIYGFAVDHGFLYGLFVSDLSLMLWTLGKTIMVKPD